ncbi:hypothetical protein E4T56_gene20601 [Termitomyces sp. T112]|nr:hypothetical protein E4T56_gene20601 [Termitomyces sp. T112]
MALAFISLKARCTPIGILMWLISSARNPAAPRKFFSNAREVGVFQHSRASTLLGSIQIPSRSTICPRIFISLHRNCNFDSLRSLKLRKEVIHQCLVCLPLSMECDQAPCRSVHMHLGHRSRFENWLLQPVSRFPPYQVKLGRVSRTRFRDTQHHLLLRKVVKASFKSQTRVSTQSLIIESTPSSFKNVLYQLPLTGGEFSFHSPSHGAADVNPFFACQGHCIVKRQGEFIPGYKPIINNQNRRPFICVNISSPGYGAWVFSKYSAHVAYGSAIVSQRFGNGQRFLLQFGRPLGALSTRIGSMSIEATRSRIPDVDISLVSQSLFTSSLLIVAALLLNPGGPRPSPEPLTCELSGQ